MADSGFIYDTTPSQMSTYFRGVIWWDCTSQNVTANTSNVTVKVLVDTTNASYDWDGTVSGFTLTINGSTYTSGSFNNNSDNGWTYSTSTSPTGRTANTIYSKSVTISHSSDGTKTFSMSCSFSLPAGGWGPGSVSMSGSGTLNTIARASVPTLSDTTPQIGSAMTIYTNRASSSFVHNISYVFGGSSGTIDTDAATSVVWTLPTSLANQIPNATSGTGTITCKTFNGGTLIGTKTINFTASVPSTYVPTIGSITHSEGEPLVTSKSIGGYVQSKSKIVLGFSGVQGSYGSTIKSYSLTFDGSTYGSSTATTGAVKGSGTLTATGTVTDSRGRKATQTATITILPYAAPKITSFTAVRANSDGTPNETGSYVKVTASGTYYRLTVSSTDKNTLASTASSREKGIGSYVSKATGTGTTGTFSLSATVAGYDILKSYDYQLAIADKFNTTYSYLVVSTGSVTMSWGVSGVGIGKVWEKGALDVGGKIYANQIELPADVYVSAGGGINLNNSDIIGANNIFMKDKATSDSEGIQWLKDDANIGSTNVADYDSFRILGGAAFINSVPMNVNPSQAVLWSGAAYMNNPTAGVVPSKTLANCANGWVLQWSDFNAGSTPPENDTDWVLTYIHKKHTALFNGDWMVFAIPNYTTSIVIKYLAIYNDKIWGHDQNDDTTTNGSIGNPNDVCLRAVWEW